MKLSRNTISVYSEKPERYVMVTLRADTEEALDQLYDDLFRAFPSREVQTLAAGAAVTLVHDTEISVITPRSRLSRAAGPSILIGEKVN